MLVNDEDRGKKREKKTIRGKNFKEAKTNDKGRKKDRIERRKFRDCDCSR